LQQLKSLKKPLIQQLQQFVFLFNFFAWILFLSSINEIPFSKNQIHPFEDETLLTKFSHKFDASLFVFGSNSKKHPNRFLTIFTLTNVLLYLAWYLDECSTINFSIWLNYMSKNLYQPPSSA
jgi:hypothetical protein